MRPESPLAHGPFHYVPVVKSLPGEFAALRRLTAEAWARTTPLIEPTTKENEDEIPGPGSMLARFGDQMRDICGIDRPFFIDPRWLAWDAQVDLGGLRRRAVDHVLRECAAYTLNAIPVVGLEDSPALRALFSATIGFERGTCIRVGIRGSVVPTGTTLQQQLDRVLFEVGVDYAKADLFLDLGYIDQEPGFTAADVNRRISSLGDLSRWRGLVLSGTVIPQDLSGWPENQTRELKRHELEIWLDLAQLSSSRRPSYSDYLIQHPRPPQGKPRGMKANIRYPTLREMVIVRGTMLNGTSRRQYHRLAKMLTARSDFDGPSFSWGDAQIDACAKGLALPRNAQDWREIGTDRHLKLTSSTLASMEAA